MANKKKVVFAEPVPLLSVSGNLNWNLCCVCQEKDGDLVCPAKNPNITQRNLGHEKFAKNVDILREYHFTFPCGRKPENYDEGCGIKETLMKNEAKWHKKCILKYTSRFSVEGLIKLTSQSPVEEENTPSTRTRSSSVVIIPKEEVCFLCKSSQKNQPLHKCMTYEIFNSIKEYATRANDTKTLAFLAEGDLVAQDSKYHSVCVLNLYHKGKDTSEGKDNDDSTCESLAFADLLLYMHAQLEESEKKMRVQHRDLKKVVL
ncbi:Thymidine kinase, cytosolic [Frankliniella fusca]|uniref:Thymidine kinase, cytosolic n=1 Tax=Frankliniella fusca TaxID=407009 RepID=A0AAE1HYT6_9NEOP|nr:Thymidine kinase, cytosolic [Frankliniella fusca]